MILTDLIIKGCEGLDVAINREQSDQLLVYLSLLNEWNQYINLTAIKSIESMVYKHIFDSVAVVPYIRGCNILDVGCGAGLPGIPLGIAKSEFNVTMIDSNSKKINFLHYVIMTLNLKNFFPIHGRVENFSFNVLIDVIISRAYAPLSKYLDTVSYLCPSGCQVIAMGKGKSNLKENAIKSSFFIRNVYEYEVPGISGMRHIIDLEKS